MVIFSHADKNLSRIEKVAAQSKTFTAHSLLIAK
jgi:hypothetical protein